MIEVVQNDTLPIRSVAPFFNCGDGSEFRSMRRGWVWLGWGAQSVRAREGQQARATAADVLVIGDEVQAL